MVTCLSIPVHRRMSSPERNSKSERGRPVDFAWNRFRHRLFCSEHHV